uniref:Uncharacterized protein n=1 Tax=Salix viminalis TaxID=40686 RepID=A0A6N2NC01_SALVM
MDRNQFIGDQIPASKVKSSFHSSWSNLSHISSIEKKELHNFLTCDDGTVVSINVLNLQRQGASRSFMAESEALRNFHHRNLFTYEYLPKGSSEKWPHPTQATHNTQQINKVQHPDLLAIDVATALDYLLHQYFF